LALLKSNSSAGTLARIVWREMCIYNEIMQNMRNVRKQQTENSNNCK